MATHQELLRSDMPFTSSSFIGKLPTDTDAHLVRALTDMFLSVYKQLVEKFPESSKTYDPASIASGAVISTTVTVPGASVGDVALASHSDSSTANADQLEISAKVTASDTVTVFFRNNYSSAVDLASGTLRVVVIKKEAL